MEDGGCKQKKANITSALFYSLIFLYLKSYSHSIVAGGLLEIS